MRSYHISVISCFGFQWHGLLQDLRRRSLVKPLWFYCEGTRIPIILFRGIMRSSGISRREPLEGVRMRCIFWDLRERKMHFDWLPLLFWNHRDVEVETSPKPLLPPLSECSLCEDGTFVGNKNFLLSLNNLPWERTANDVRPFIVHANICAAYTLEYLMGFEDSHGCANFGAIAKLRVLVSVSSRSELLMVTICHLSHL